LAATGPDLIDIGPALGLPRLPRSRMMLYAKIEARRAAAAVASFRCNLPA
jgi:hypothetical protein